MKLKIYKDFVSNLNYQINKTGCEIIFEDFRKESIRWIKNLDNEKKMLSLGLVLNSSERTRQAKNLIMVLFDIKESDLK